MRGAAPPDGYLETETAMDIRRSLDMARQTRVVTMIAGASGVGKTTAIRQYCGEQVEYQNPVTLEITITSGMGSLWHVANALLEMKTGLGLRKRGFGLDGAFDWLKYTVLSG